ncbi:MAG: hypothetical protein KGJ84_07195 [Elusimicrobia bacterium]|nr:hypothetical protein [Elusimicrobiota bacterium]
MRTVIAASLLALASSAYAAGPEGLPAFSEINFTRIRAMKTELKAPQGRAGDVITDYHLLAQAGKSALYGYAQTPEQAAEATAYWTKVLTAAGVKAGAATYADGMYTIPYATADGRVIRDFLADPRQFPPKDESGLRANMALAQSALTKAGLTVVSARVINVDALLPTYSVLYLTKADENPDHEARLRVLKPGDDIDVDVYRGAGVNVVQVPETWMLVYIGPELGYVTVIGKTQDEIAEKLAKRKDFLVSEGKRLIADKIVPLDDADYKFAAAIYFFQ